MLDWIFEGIVGWVGSIVSQLMDAVSGLFLEALGTDMTAMEEYFPFVTKAYEGLRVYTSEGELIQYRVTEIKTNNGSSLMPGPIWEGDLLREKDGEHQFEVVLSIVNSPILELPETGGNTLLIQPWIVLALLCVSALAVIQLIPQPKRKEK